MPFGAIAGGLAAGIGGSLISGALGGGGGTGATNSNGVYQYIPTNQPGMDTNFNNYYNTYGSTLGNYYNTVNPLASTILGQQFNDNYQNNYLTGAQTAQGAYYGAGAGAQQAGAAEYGLGNQLANAASSWGLNGTELQQLQQQSADTANSQSYLRGVQNSPYGAAIATNAVDNTNLAYAQQQAATQAQLAGAATSAYGAGTSQYGTGAGYYGTGAALPYTAQQSILGNQSNALSQYYGSSVQPYLSGLNQLQGNALQYLGYGNTANNTAAGNAQSAQNLYSNLVSGGANLGNSIYGALNSSGGSGYNFSMPGGNSMYGNSSGYDYYGSSPDYAASAFGY